MTTAQSTHAASALPSGDDDEEAVAVAPNSDDLDRERAAELLAFARTPTRTPSAAPSSGRSESHADHGGTEDVSELKDARDVVLEGQPRHYQWPYA